jgi:hypothetical protein
MASTTGQQKVSEDVRRVWGTRRLLGNATRVAFGGFGDPSYKLPILKYCLALCRTLNHFVARARTARLLSVEVYENELGVCGI